MTVDPQRFAHLTFGSFRVLVLERDLTRHERIGSPDAYREDKTEFILADIAGKLTHLDRDRMRVLDIGPGCGELPAPNGVTKIPGRFPEECRDLLASRQRGFDVILIYRVFQYVVDESDPIGFVDAALELLDRAAQMLIGDIPNRPKRERFFASAGQATSPAAGPIHASPIDDEMLLAVVARARARGVEAYLVPQGPGLHANG